MPYVGNIGPTENIHHTAHKPSLHRVKVINVATNKESTIPPSQRVVQTPSVYHLNVCCAVLTLTITMMNVIYFVFLLAEL